MLGSLCALDCSPLHGIMGRVGRSQLLFAVDEKGMGELVVKCLVVKCTVPETCYFSLS